MAGQGGRYRVLVTTPPPGADIVVIIGGTSRLIEGRKVPVDWVEDTLTLEYCMLETVRAGACTVMVLVVPGAIWIEVVYAGSVMVVADGRALGGRTKRQGAVHWAGVPLYTKVFRYTTWRSSLALSDVSK